MGPNTEPNERPLFVVLDGIDGCGKSTQAKRLAAVLPELRSRGRSSTDPAVDDLPRGNGAGEERKTLHLREPGSTPAGEAIRALVLAPEPHFGRGTLALLFAAARRETLEELVAPALAEGRDVVIERFHASTFAYQGVRQCSGREPQHFDDDALLALLLSLIHI